MIGGQPERNELEKSLPDYARAQLDQARDAIRKDALAHPAICAALIRIEGKLDEVLMLLRAHT